MTFALFHPPARLAARPRSRPAGDKLGENCFYWFLVLTPLWWLLGALTPLAVLGTLFLFVRRPPRDLAVLAVALAWMLVGAAQATSGLVAWFANAEAGGELPFRLISMPVTGWVLLGAAIGVGAEYRLASPRIVRATSIYGGLILLVGLGAIAFAIATGRQDIEVPTPVAMLLPLTSDDMRQQFTMRFIMIDDAFLDAGGIPRLILFFPWSTGLAMAGMMVAAIAWSERSRSWRMIGIGGGLFGLVFSLSRAAAVAAAVSFALLWYLRLRMRIRLALAGAAALVVNGAIACGVDPIELFRQTMAAFTEARAGSSEARNWIYEASWRGFLEAPLLGHGGIGPILNAGVPVRLGSHSTFFGTLYTGGIVTFGAVVVAYLATFLVLAMRAGRNGYYGKAAFGLWIAFGMLCYGEAMYSLVPGCLVMFVWFGAGMALRPPARTPSLTAS